MEMKMVTAATLPLVPFHMGADSASADEAVPVIFSVRSAEHVNLADATNEASAGSAGTQSDHIDSDIIERDHSGSQMRLYL